ncbi:MAG: sulfite exporter TauE/SafE family protein [Pseudomonadota bacterium]
MDAVTLSWTTLLAITPVMLFAGLVHGALGLGFPLVATPLIAVFIDVRLAIIITLLPTAVVNVASITGQRNFRRVAIDYLPLALASTLGALVGAAVLALSDTEIFRLLLALLIFVFLWTQYRGNSSAEWLPGNRTLLLIFIGLLAGFAAGTTNVMVAILLIYFLTAGIARAEMVTAMNLCFLIGKLSQIVVFFITGLVSVTLLIETLPLAAVALGALLAGQRIGDRIPQQRYRHWLQILLAVLAVILLLQFIIHTGT